MTTWAERYDHAIEQRAHHLREAEGYIVEADRIEAEERCSWMPERGGWQCTGPAGHDTDSTALNDGHRFRQGELPESFG